MTLNHGTNVGVVLHTFMSHCLLQTHNTISNTQHALVLNHSRGSVQMVELVMGTDRGQGRG